MATDERPAPPPEVIDYYNRFAEESRFEHGAFRLEFERTKHILTRFLPKPPATIVDVGGAAGAYAFWLAEGGYTVHLVDATPRLIDLATRRSAASPKPLAGALVADARRVPHPNGATDAVLLMGPLYHLTERADRGAALLEASRLLRTGGMLFAGGISRYASALDGLSRKLSLDPRFARIRDRDLLDGQHRNETDDVNYFVTSYFHQPEDLHAELTEAGFQDVRVLGVEGPGWLFDDLETRWAAPELRQDLLDVALALEEAPSIIGASAHLLAVGTRGPGGAVTQAGRANSRQ